MEYLKEWAFKVKNTFEDMSDKCKLATIVAIVLFIAYFFIGFPIEAISNKEEEAINDIVSSVYEELETSIDEVSQYEEAFEPLREFTETQDEVKKSFHISISFISFFVTGIIWSFFEIIEKKEKENASLRCNDEKLYLIPRSIYFLIEAFSLTSTVAMIFGWI